MIREPLLDEASFNSMLQYREQVAIPKLLAAIASTAIDPDARASLKRRLFNNLWDAALLSFSGGRALEIVARSVGSAIEAFGMAVSDEHASLDDVDLANQETYVEALWLLSLSRLLGLGNPVIERVANLYSDDETNDGSDELFEILLAKLGRKSFPAEGLIHEDPYQLLLDCIKAEPEDRPALMTQFLKRWFKGQKECDWWGSHIPRKGTTVLDTGFFGYWAFEAALVTYLWDIDDSSYRDLPHYPKDLVDYARQHAATSQVQHLATRVLGGERCPSAGWWFTPARAGSRQRFEEGQLMPEVGGDYGATIWQWDVMQD